MISIDCNTVVHNDNDNDNCFFLSEVNKFIIIYIPFLSHKIPCRKLFFLPVCIKVILSSMLPLSDVIIS